MACSAASSPGPPEEGSPWDSSRRPRRMVSARSEGSEARAASRVCSCPGSLASRLSSVTAWAPPAR